jgi:peptidoglycan/xylan/chitin deacetylase (PgdA/CDA1 family)
MIVRCRRRKIGYPGVGSGGDEPTPPLNHRPRDEAENMTGAIPILVYHQVTSRSDPAFDRYSITPAAFAAQMAWLAYARYTTVGLDTLLDSRAGRGALPRRTVAITFDDGLRKAADCAVPILAARGFTATFFLVAGAMGTTSRWTQSEVGVGSEIIDWPTARRLESAGLSCGSHTMSHRRLPALASEAVFEELSASRRRLEDELGHVVTHLAYPFGAYDDRVRGLVAAAGYRSACSTRRGPSPPDDDPLALHRLTIYGHDSLLDFVCRIRTGQSSGELARWYIRRLLGRDLARRTRAGLARTMRGFGWPSKEATGSS